MYCYFIYENKIKVFTSQLFSTLKEAVDYFWNIDKPEHYANQNFYYSELASFITNTGTAESKTKILIKFAEVELMDIYLKEWKKILPNNV